MQNTRRWIEFHRPGCPRAQPGRRGRLALPGIYYTPAGKKPRVAMVATHYNIDFSQHYLAEYIAARGIGFLGWNTRFRGDESHFSWDHALVDIGVGVRWLRDEIGVETVTCSATPAAGH